MCILFCIVEILINVVWVRVDFSSSDKITVVPIAIKCNNVIHLKIPSTRSLQI